MKQYYVFDFPLEMYGIGLVFAILLLLIVYRACRRTKAGRTTHGSGNGRSGQA